MLWYTPQMSDRSESLNARSCRFLRNSLTRQLRSAGPFFVAATRFQFLFNQLTNFAYTRNPGTIQNSGFSSMSSNSSRSLTADEADILFGLRSMSVSRCFLCSRFQCIFNQRSPGSFSALEVVLSCPRTSFAMKSFFQSEKCHSSGWCSENEKSKSATLLAPSFSKLARLHLK